MANSETVDRILRTATALFAERGFSETSLRTITAMANVNLAAVNYHFGNKKALIQAVFAQFLTPFCRELEQRLVKMEQTLKPGELPLAEDLFRLLLESFLDSVTEVDDRPQRFMRLLGLAYMQSQEHLRAYLISSYGHTYARFVTWLNKIQPSLEPVEFYWRTHLALGAMIFTMGSFDSLQNILKADYKVDTNLNDSSQYFIDALLGLLQKTSATRVA